MSRRLSIAWMGLAVWSFAAPAFAQDLVAKTEPLPAEEQQKKFHLPPGFEIQLVAAEPDVRKPMNLNFDRRGRLFVTNSIEYPFPAPSDRAARDYVRILADIGPDGRAKTVTTFAEGLNIPIGVLPVRGGAMVYGIPQIYFLPDADDDGRAEAAQVLYGQFGFQDTHGMASSFTRGLDGWIYACHGFSNTSQVKGADGKEVVMQSGNTYRLRPDGSNIEQFTHGQTNPFGMCFDPLGNLFTADCHSLPAYMILRGAYYPSFGKPHDGLGYGPTIMSHLHGTTGIAGVTYYAAEQFPQAYRDTLFIGNPVSGRINHDRLEVHGSTYKAIEQPDFLTCDDPWFRPVDLKLGPDGALYIADFYNRIIGHYEVPLTHPGRDRERGRIWRVIYTGEGAGERPQPPDLSQADLPAALVRLADPNLAVRTLATTEVVERFGAAAIEPLCERMRHADSSPRLRAHGLWALERLGALSDEWVERLAGDPERLVRVHLVKALAERSDWATSKLDLAELVRGRLKDEDAYVRRAAADALGRHSHAENVAGLIELWEKTPPGDTHLIHTVRMALRDQFLAENAYAAFAPSRTADAVLRRIAEVSMGAKTGGAALFLLTCLEEKPDVAPGGAVEHTARYLPAESLPRLYAQVRTQPGVGAHYQAGCLRALQRATQERGVQLPTELGDWATDIGKQLLRASRGEQAMGIELAREMRLEGLFEDLAALAADPAADDLRLTAIDACVANDGERAAAVLGAILESAANAITIRQKAAQGLASINSDASRRELLTRLPTAPQRLAVEIAAALAGSRAGGELLLGEIAAGRAAPSVLQEPIVVDRLRGSQIEKLDERLAELTSGLGPRDDRLHQLIDQRLNRYLSSAANADQGYVVFQKNCAICHRLAGEGAKIGPDLEGVGRRGPERLLEDLLDPSRNIDLAFRSTSLVTADGQILSGLVLREEGETLVLADAQGKEVRVPLADIEQRKASNLSPMPANVLELLSEDDLSHLLAYLISKVEVPQTASQ